MWWNVLFVDNIGRGEFKHVLVGHGWWTRRRYKVEHQDGGRGLGHLGSIVLRLGGADRP